jgi:hypothetical protein
MEARGSLERGDLDSVSLGLHISKAWRAGHYEHNISDRETLELPWNDPTLAWVAINAALREKTFAPEKRLLNSH